MKRYLCFWLFLAVAAFIVTTRVLRRNGRYIRTDFGNGDC